MARAGIPPGQECLSRDAALVALSRDHHGVLIQALALRRFQEAREGAERTAVLRHFLAAFSGEILGHMDDEEAVLLPRTEALDPPGADRVRLEHAELRRLAEELRRRTGAGESPTDLAVEIGWLLHDHVRFEERGFFETAQRGLTPKDLSELGRALAERRSLRGAGACPLVRP